MAISMVQLCNNQTAISALGMQAGTVGPKIPGLSVSMYIHKLYSLPRSLISAQEGNGPIIVMSAAKHNYAEHMRIRNERY